MSQQGLTELQRAQLAGWLLRYFSTPALLRTVDIGMLREVLDSVVPRRSSNEFLYYRAGPGVIIITRSGVPPQDIRLDEAPGEPPGTADTAPRSDAPTTG